MNKDEMKLWIKKNEGYDNMPYLCTAGKLTIGYGRNLQDCGISHDEAELMLDNDMKRTETELLSLSWYHDQPTDVKDALFNMCFNLGLSRLLEFKNMINAIKEKNYTHASIEALNSKWAVEVGQRAKDVALMLRNGNELETGTDRSHQPS